MKIELNEIAIRDLVKGYKDSAEEGVVGYNGLLDIRPKYQREFVYSGKQRDAVIDTWRKGFPLNVMYWIKNPDGSFELLDGQQRTISLCQYVNGDFSINDFYFHNLSDDEQRHLLDDYKIMVYFCEGTDDEKLAWFQTINIAGEKLFPQEILNALYTGPWLTDAKRHFSKTNCAAHQLGGDYLSGSAIRQDYLEKVLKWINGGNPRGYMAKNQHKPNANELWMYFVNVINWVKMLFPKYRREMKGLDWGEFYNKYHENDYDATQLETQVSALMQDEDLQNTKGIYEYVLSGDEKYLNFRAFLDRDKRITYEKQKGICPHCHNHFEINQMEADHITPWSKGGKTILENCQMLCRECNRKKSNN